MDFPSFGDASQYLELSHACAHSISGVAGPGTGCYHPYRPIGIVLYYALPFLFTDDQVMVSYLTLLMNLLLLLLLLVSGLALIRQFAHANRPRITRDTPVPQLDSVVFVVGTLVLSIGFLPVRLSDHQSLALFMASVALLSASGGQPKKSTALIAGVLAGSAVLFKQNYAVAVTFLLVSWLAVFGKKEFRLAIVPACWFAVGASFGLLQIIWVYCHTGVPWLYDPVAMRAFAPTNQQPAVELVAYSIPELGSYVEQLAHPVSGFEYFATKFYLGLTKFYWSVYLGVSPADNQTPQLVSFSKLRMMMFEVVFFFTAFLSFASLACRQRWLAVLVITAFCSTALSVVMAHMESRYFYFLRIAYLIYAIVLVRELLVWYARRKAVHGALTGT
ncbi:hypothetical protein R69927_04651 [Paraburkholderia domus]|uniref:hypothetical protein n=1 Tax=Paraburkholderia domus TaxID=2793075 RepID=UPI001912CDE5|nr:hypothetical protein [Paraburkholderia domus]MBK5089007.1 hypothetical protein [Burkholderia sp. R-69927]CAE6888079.1 hypothetical protein R69927_04651 [Paraburkholderia domus]